MGGRIQSYDAMEKAEPFDLCRAHKNENPKLMRTEDLTSHSSIHSRYHKDIQLVSIGSNLYPLKAFENESQETC